MSKYNREQREGLIDHVCGLIMNTSDPQQISMLVSSLESLQEFVRNFSSTRETPQKLEYKVPVPYISPPPPSYFKSPFHVTCESKDITFTSPVRYTPDPSTPMCGTVDDDERMGAHLRSLGICPDDEIGSPEWRDDE